MMYYEKRTQIALQSSYECHDISNHQQLNYLFSSLVRPAAKKVSKLCKTGPLWGGPVTGGFRTRGFPSQRASKAESISMSWYHHGIKSPLGTWSLSLWHWLSCRESKKRLRWIFLLRQAVKFWFLLLQTVKFWLIKWSLCVLKICCHHHCSFFTNLGHDLVIANIVIINHHNQLSTYQWLNAKEK